MGSVSGHRSREKLETLAVVKTAGRNFKKQKCCLRSWVVMKALLARVSMVHAIGAQLCVLHIHALPRTGS